MISCSKPKQAVYTQPRTDDIDDGDVSTTYLAQLCKLH